MLFLLAEKAIELFNNHLVSGLVSGFGK